MADFSSFASSGSKKDDIPYSAFPSDFIDPALKKEKKYNIDYCKAAYYEFVKNIQLLSVTRRNDFIDNRLYAEGNQRNEKYKKPFTFKNEPGKQPYSFVDLDYTPVSVLPGYRDIVISYLKRWNMILILLPLIPYQIIPVIRKCIRFGQKRCLITSLKKMK